MALPSSSPILFSFRFHQEKKLMLHSIFSFSRVIISAFMVHKCIYMIFMYSVARLPHIISHWSATISGMTFHVEYFISLIFLQKKIIMLHEKKSIFCQLYFILKKGLHLCKLFSLYICSLLMYVFSIRSYIFILFFLREEGERRFFFPEIAVAISTFFLWRRSMHVEFFL